MSDHQVEIPLGGGRSSQGVVRVGNTVRRLPTPNSDFAHSLLRHLADRGFEGAPASLGIDEAGRDVFSFIEGTVPADLARHGDDTLRHAARLIRRFHDLGAEVVATRAAAAAGIETICHNDLSPCNFVFRGGVPTALIDFDTVAPGSRAHDVGYAAWLWLDLGSPESDAAEQARRLMLFLDAYGDIRSKPVVAAALARQTALAARGKGVGDEAMAGWAAACLKWTSRNRRTLTGT